MRDITGRKRTEERIIRLAYQNILTGLLNRNSFKDHLGQAVAHAQRHGRYVATLFIDLDRFKRINDTFGYKVGDLLLQGVAERINEGLRKSDKAARNVDAQYSQCVSRLGGDEFTILLPEVNRIQDAAKVAKRILDSISRPLIIAGHEIFITGVSGSRSTRWMGKMPIHRSKMPMPRCTTQKSRAGIITSFTLRR